MKAAHRAAAVLVLAAAGLGGCRDRLPEAAAPNDTSVLGGYGPGAAATAPPQLTDASGRAIPRPPAPAAVPVQVARSGDEGALALWVQDGRVVAAAFERARGWSAPQALEEIYGEATDAQLASNGRGAAMALWRHTVGSIESLRYSRFDAATGWSQPDVVPGALPRPHAAGPAGERDAPQLEMDANGNVTARWPSGFDAAEMQVARHEAGRGWSTAASEPLAQAPAPAAAPAQ